ncbi:hypothetical protein PGT21_010963 [Puccinia graminis f. sp. tritici]|uniref:Uncharacterized protein n=1 Tax=Puccinia graminis f. sp. tritici TaxID=56615 RepID=A0A5B0PNL5_PUCGR|nr:hypothetical protein PGT21_010963 [Puccinia graminis f. sp. tritici]
MLRFFQLVRNNMGTTLIRDKGADLKAIREPLQNCNSSEKVSKPPDYYESLRRTFGIPFASHCEMYLDQGPGRPPLRAHISKHFRTNFGNVSNPCTRSVSRSADSPDRSAVPYVSVQNGSAKTFPVAGLHYGCRGSKHFRSSFGNVSKYAPAGADVLDLGPGTFRNVMRKGFRRSSEDLPLFFRNLFEVITKLCGFEINSEARLRNGFKRVSKDFRNNREVSKLFQNCYSSAMALGWLLDRHPCLL